MLHRVTPLLRKALVSATLAIGAAGASMSTDLLVARVSAQEQPRAPIPGGIVRMQGDPDSVSIQGAPAVGNMTYHGGPVQHTQKIFTIFWQGNGTPFPSGYQTTINQFVRDLSFTPYYGIGSQYGDAIAKINPTLTFGGTWLDTTNVLPNAALSSEDLLAEVNRAKAANGWTNDANTYFQIYTPAGIGSAFSGICGLHYFFNPAFGRSSIRSRAASRARRIQTTRSSTPRSTSRPTRSSRPSPIRRATAGSSRTPAARSATCAPGCSAPGPATAPMSS
jgi:hypothetical protein